jgi:hypothetical protein
LLRFDELENRRVLSISPFSLFWSGGEFAELDEHDEDDEAEERYEYSRGFGSQYRDSEDDDLQRDDEEMERWEDAEDWEHDEDEHWERDEVEEDRTPESNVLEHWEDDARWETEEEHEVTIELADNLLRSSFVSDVGSPIDALRDSVTADASTLELADSEPADNFAKRSEGSLEDKNEPVAPTSVAATAGDLNDVGSDDDTADQDDGRETAASAETEGTDANSDRVAEETVDTASESAGSGANRTESAETTTTVATPDASVQQVTPNRQADGGLAGVSTDDASGRDSSAGANGAWEALLPAVATATDSSRFSDGPIGFHGRTDTHAVDSRGTPLPGQAASLDARITSEPRHLFDSIPQDLAGLERALQALLRDQRQIGRSLVDWVMDPNVLRWILATSVAVVVFEAARRKVRHASPEDEKLSDDLLPDDEHAAPLRLFPELFGLAPLPKQ